MGYRHIYPALVIFVGLITRLTGEKSVLVKTSYGPIKGEQLLSIWTNQTIYSFKGIPYATPPTEDRRFKDPIPPDSWSQVRDCTKEQAVCPQTFPTTEPLVTSEDCLYLNVYTPQLLSSELKLLPVMVWIHGGAFREGSGNYDLYGPDLLVAEGVVVVTLNYRLGALGFLSMGVHDAPGNVGLKDQTQALLWVASEIRGFGGDPHQVTLFGESAGAISIHLHYYSPLSAGLFHRAIGNSGTPLAYRVRRDGRPHALQLAKQLGCGTEDTTEVLACLRAANHQDIIKAQDLIKAPQDDKTGLSIFVPTIDRDSAAKPFLPDFPFNLMKQKKTFFVPFLMGVNSKEGIIRLFRSEEEIRNITNNLEYLYALQIPEDNVCSSKLKAEKIKQFYFKDDLPSNLHANGYVDLYTDVLYAYGTVISARHFQNTAKVFLYYFSFSGTFKSEYVEKIQKKYDISGVCHAEELLYLFIVKGSNQTLGDNSKESTTWRRIVKMWTNFAKHGTPTLEPDPLLQNVQWLPASEGKTNHLHIDDNLTMSSEDLLAPRAALWDSITFNHCS